MPSKIHQYMAEAIKLAEECRISNDVPIGCVIIKNDEIIGRGRNRVEEKSNATMHAEIEAINQAISAVGDKNLSGCEMFVTLEPCSMCAGASVLARIDKIYFGAFDQKTGAAGSKFNIAMSNELNHNCEVYGGIMEDECSKLLKDFFKDIRKSKNAK